MAKRWAFRARDHLTLNTLGSLYHLSRRKHLFAVQTNAIDIPRYTFSPPSVTPRLPTYNGGRAYARPSIAGEYINWKSGQGGDGQVTPDFRCCGDVVGRRRHAFYCGDVERRTGRRSACRGTWRNPASPSRRRIVQQPCLALVRDRLPARFAAARRPCAGRPYRGGGIIRRSHRGRKVTHETLSASLFL
jgi:hypothetical protein